MPGAGTPAPGRPTLVIGLDLSLTATGIAQHDGTTHTIRCRNKGDHRLCEIRDYVDYSTVLDVDLVVIEDLPTHAYSAGLTGMVHGAVRELLCRKGLPVALIAPATLKKYATGRGNADKAAMAVAAYKRLGLENVDDNRVDAAWLRAAGLDRLGCPAVVLPETQRAALGKAQWPAGAGERRG